MPDALQCGDKRFSVTGKVVQSSTATCATPGATYATPGASPPAAPAAPTFRAPLADITNLQLASAPTLPMYPQPVSKAEVTTETSEPETDAKDREAEVQDVVVEPDHVGADTAGVSEVDAAQPDDDPARPSQV